jgi:CHAT domain-containing protein
VDDRATGELMKRFYSNLKAGKPKDEALRLSQVDLLQSPETASPIFWAAFQLNGDWK